jgi:hypothetical protein
LNVAGRSAIGGFVTGTIGGAAGGFVGGYAAGYLMTDDSGAAWDMAINGAITGGITGGVFGSIRGFRAARALGRNPWAGIAAETGMTNAELVQSAATRAENAIGGTGRFAGTAKHTYATNLLERYQSIYGSRGIEVNKFFNNGVGNRGFLDVLDNTNGIIYDFKFGNAVMSPAQYTKYWNNFGLPIQIIRP